MQIFFFTFAILALAFAGMALGVLCGRVPLRPGCGSTRAACEACTRPCPRRAEASGREAAR